MIDISVISNDGINRIFKEDYNSQIFYLKTICDEVRNIPVEAILAARAIFIPNDDYIKLYFGDDSLDPKYNFYDSYGNCLWLNKLMIPITNIIGEIVGFIGFDPFKHIEAHETGNFLLNYYTYSTKKIFRKGDYLFAVPNTFLNAYHDGYLVITDGVFDTLFISYYGFHCAAMLGSVVTDQLAAQLRLIDRVIVLMDNDEAGLQLYDKIKKVHPGAIFLKQGKVKDADDILKTEYREFYLHELQKCIENKIPLSKIMYTKDLSNKIGKNKSLCMK